VASRDAPFACRRRECCAKPREQTRERDIYSPEEVEIMSPAIKQNGMAAGAETLRRGRAPGLQGGPSHCNNLSIPSHPRAATTAGSTRRLLRYYKEWPPGRFVRGSRAGEDIVLHDSEGYILAFRRCYRIQHRCGEQKMLGHHTERCQRKYLVHLNNLLTVQTRRMNEADAHLSRVL
jgi:hypothetical protein